MSLSKRSGFWSASFFREFLKLSIPIILSNLMGSSLHIIDNIMVGNLGELELASVTQANQLTFILRLTLFGIASGCAIFASQHWGNGDILGVRRVMGISFISAIAICAAASVLAVGFSDVVMRVYSPDPAVIELGGEYLRIVGLSYIIVGISTVYNAANRSTERVRINLVASVTAIALNTFLNFCLIFGMFGFPRMGVRGVAISTAFSACVEAAIQIGWTYLGKYPAAARLRELIPESAAFVKRYYKLAVPVMLNECVWAAGTSAYMAIYGRMSTQSVAAMNIYSTFDQVIMAAVWGAMNATSVMVGKRIGAGEEEEAVACGKRMLIMGVIIAVIMGVVLWFTRTPILSLFNISGEAKAAAAGVMGIAATILWIRAFNAVNVVGILRAGGDAVFSMLLDGGAIWLIGVPMAWLGGLILDQPLPIVFLMVQSEELLKVFIGLARFRSRKWVNNLVKK